MAATPATPVAAPPPPQPLRLPALDGHLLGATLHAAPDPWARLLINSATAVRQRYYARFARWLAARGVSVLTYDYRGIGASRLGPLAHAEHRMRDWGARDFPGALAELERRVPGALPTFALGHSFGGQAFGLSPASRRLAGIVFVGSQSGWVGLPGGVAREWASWCRTPGYVLEHEEEAAHTWAALDMPRLVVSFADDGYAPRAAVEALCAWMPPGYERVELAPADVGAERIGHFGAFRRGFEGTLWAPLLAWLRRQA